MPAVSVILPTCDRPVLVGRALRSILEQTWMDLEVLLVDSNRSTGPVQDNGDLKQLLRDPRVEIISGCRPVNAAHARNLGLERARGDWIAYLDDDDVYHPDKLTEQLSLGHASGSPLVVCGFAVNLRHRRRIRQITQECFAGDSLLLEASWATPLLFHRRESRLRFDLHYPVGHDELFAQRLIKEHRLTEVPNCTSVLVEVYPQIGRDRVHSDFENVWRTYRAVYSEIGSSYSRKARRAYLLKGMLTRAKGGRGSWSRLMGLAIAMVLIRQGRDWRLAMNALAYRTRLLRAFIVT